MLFSISHSSCLPSTQMRPKRAQALHLPVELLIPISSSHSRCPPSTQMRPKRAQALHLPVVLLIPISAFHSSCPPSVQRRQIISNTWGWEEWKQLKFYPIESSSFIFSKLNNLCFQHYFSFRLSYNSNNLSSINKADGHCKVPLHALKCQLSTTRTKPSMFRCCPIY